MNKKGAIEAKEMGKWIAFIIFMIFCVFLFYLVTTRMIRIVADTSNEAIDIYTLKFVKDSDCLAFNLYGIKIVGVIDVKKFNSGLLTNCLNRKGFSSKLVLKYANESLIAFNNEESYQLDNRLCFSSKYKCVSKEFYIIVNDKDKIFNASLNISGVLNVS